MNIPINVFMWVMAFLPIAVLLVLMIKFQWGATEAAPIGLLITIITGIFFYKADLTLIAAESAKGIWNALIILTAVEHAALNFRKENQVWLSDVSVEDAKKYVAEGHFAPGSMLPKVEASIRFAESKEGRRSLITLLDKAADGIAGKTGTVIHL